jgi:hypothetical protein
MLICWRSAREATTRPRHRTSSAEATRSFVAAFVAEHARTTPSASHRASTALGGVRDSLERDLGEAELGGRMEGFGCVCPCCGSSERVSLFVLDSAAVRFSHRCRNCGVPSALAAWSAPPGGPDPPLKVAACPGRRGGGGANLRADGSAALGRLLGRPRSARPRDYREVSLSRRFRRRDRHLARA